MVLIKFTAALPPSCLQRSLRLSLMGLLADIIFLRISCFLFSLLFCFESRGTFPSSVVQIASTIARMKSPLACLNNMFLVSGLHSLRSLSSPRYFFIHALITSVHDRSSIQLIIYEMCVLFIDFLSVCTPQDTHQIL